MVTHGMSGTRTYKIWSNMLFRCRGGKEDYIFYGSRGIKVCKRWRTFENFYADMGECPPGLTLDRIDGTKGYNPKNCRWTTFEIQKRNRRPMRSQQELRRLRKQFT